MAAYPLNIDKLLFRLTEPLLREFYEDLKRKLKNSGYVISDTLINSIEYGVPQDRDRIILFGIKEKLLTNKAIIEEDKTIGKSEFNIHRYTKYDVSSVFEYDWADISKYQENSILGIPDNIPEDLTVEHWFRKKPLSKLHRQVDSF